MVKVDWDLYDYWLGLDKSSAKDSTIDAVISGILDNLENNPAYQEDATRNGESQPILATRTETMKCKITVIPGDEMYIGDLVEVFGEHWLCMELYTDEYSVKYGELWMCNQVFHFQNRMGDIIHRYAILDDGSFASGNDKAIKVINGKYVCYMSLDNETRGISLDRRLAIGTVLDDQGEPVLETGKVTGIDTKNRNYGKGSHLLTFYLSEDVYNEEKDDLKNCICDRIDKDDAGGELVPPIQVQNFFIEGRDQLRIGTARTYTLQSEADAGNKYKDCEWSTDASFVELKSEAEQCIVKIPLDEKLIGKKIKLVCVIFGETVEKILEVIDFG